jgi:hypothetical protein
MLVVWLTFAEFVLSVLLLDAEDKQCFIADALFLPEEELPSAELISSVPRELLLAGELLLRLAPEELLLRPEGKLLSQDREETWLQEELLRPPDVELRLPAELLFTRDNRSLLLSAEPLPNVVLQ